MKTPEEIKRGLECCSSTANCADGCPYHVTAEGSFGCDEMGCDDGLLPDALALIRQLEAQVPRWISVKERQPTKEEAMRCHTVLVFYDGRYITQYGAYYSGWEWEYNDGLCWSELYITHWLWMPEIAEPEEE